MTEPVAVLFLTHRWNRLLQLKFERLLAEVGGRADCFVVLQDSDEANEAFETLRPVGGSLFRFDKPRLPELLGYPFMTSVFHGKDDMFPGSTHFPILAFARQNPGYEYYFTVEFDVDFTGNWGDMVMDVIASSPDLASLHFGSHKERPKWHWWKFYRSSEEDIRWASANSQLRRSFNPIYCLSRKGIELVDEAHQDGWCGHYELLLATILNQRGCKLVDLGEVGGYCEGSEQNPRKFLPVSALATVRWRPEVEMNELRRRSTGRTLFHPIKDDWMYDGEKIVSLSHLPGKESQ